MQRTIWVTKRAPGGTCQHRLSALRRHRRALLLCLLLVLVAGPLAACGRAEKGSAETQDSFKVTFSTEPAPPVTGAGTILLTLHDAAGHPVDSAKVAVEANMSHAGMVPVHAEAAGGPGGAYRVPLRWTMVGDWYVDVKFILPDGQVVGRRFPTRVR